jgi:hypothetical protein
MRAGRAVRAVTLIGRAVSGRYLAHGVIRDADCVVAFSFGLRRAQDGSIDPGDVNRHLATQINNLDVRLPLIAQGEIDDALRQQFALEADVRVTSPSGRYLDTHDVVVAATTAMSARGWKRALVIAQAHHMPRADSTMRALGVETVTPAQMPSVWDHRSRQRWTRGRAGWALRETVVVVYYLLRGWLE